MEKAPRRKIQTVFINARPTGRVERNQRPRGKEINTGRDGETGGGDNKTGRGNKQGEKEKKITLLPLSVSLENGIFHFSA
jgi:hypothetical protein